MMALRIALLIVAFSSSLGYVQSIGLFSYQHEGVNSLTASDIQSNTPGLVNYSSSTSNIYIFGDFLRVLNTVAILIRSAILPAGMLMSFGVPSTIAILLNLMCWFFYALSVIQILGNRSERLMR